MKKMEGKVAIVTGGASGVGLGTVKKLAEEGAAVDVAEETSVKEMIDKTVQAYDRLDILHNNAA